MAKIIGWVMVKTDDSGRPWIPHHETLPETKEAARKETFAVGNVNFYPVYDYPVEEP